jgi:hypothetical protein
MAAFWLVAPCSVDVVYRRLRAACCLRRPDDGESKQLQSDYIAQQRRRQPSSCYFQFCLHLNKDIEAYRKQLIKLTINLGLMYFSSASMFCRTLPIPHGFSFPNIVGTWVILDQISVSGVTREVRHINYRPFNRNVIAELNHSQMKIFSSSFIIV